MGTGLRDGHSSEPCKAWRQWEEERFVLSQDWARRYLGMGLGSNALQAWRQVTQTGP